MKEPGIMACSTARGLSPSLMDIDMKVIGWRAEILEKAKSGGLMVSATKAISCRVFATERECIFMRTEMCTQEISNKECAKVLGN